MTKLKITAMSLTVVGVLCFIAGSPAFGFIPRTPANFAGIALLLISGLCWAIPRKNADC
jgi:drug/metabolite transporter (DMT)-like permease